MELCLRRSERNNGNSNATNDDEDINIDVEGEEYEEYEWAGQTRVRASSLLEGGYSATGNGSIHALIRLNLMKMFLYIFQVSTRQRSVRKMTMKMKI